MIYGERLEQIFSTTIYDVSESLIDMPSSTEDVKTSENGLHTLG